MRGGVGYRWGGVWVPGAGVVGGGGHWCSVLARCCYNLQVVRIQGKLDMGKSREGSKIRGCGR